MPVIYWGQFEDSNYDFEIYLGIQGNIEQYQKLYLNTCRHSVYIVSLYVFGAWVIMG